ncbi:MAG: EAL domain-containing protein [Halioglobus sp.]
MPVSYRSKLLLCVLVVVLGTLASNMLALSRATSEISARLVAQKLAFIQRGFSAQLDSEIERLQVWADALVADVAARRTLIGADQDAFNRMFFQYRETGDAHLGLLLDQNLEVVLGTREVASLSLSPADGMPTSGARSLRAAAVVDGTPYQLVLTPLSLQDFNGWIGVGTALDDAFFERLRSTLGAELTLVYGNESDAHVASTLDVDWLRRERRGAGVSTSTTEVLQWLESYNWVSKAVPLDGLDTVQIQVVLSTSLDAVLAQHQPIRSQMVLAAVAAMLLAIIAAVLIARWATLPVARLINTVEKIADGDYTQEVSLGANRELHKLGGALNTMRQSIAERELRIRHHALHDMVTQLPNRDYIRSRFDSQLRDGHSGSEFALCLLQMRNLSKLAELYGTSFSDSALKAVADRLCEKLRRGDLCARVADNQILLFYEGLDYAGVEQVVKKLHREFGDPVLVQGVALQVELTLGFVLCPQHGHDFDDVLRRAQIALARARFSNDLYEIYRIGQDESHLRQIRMASRLQLAVEERAFTLLYQPKYRLEQQSVEEVEALLRWSDEELGEVSPEEFIPLAEQMGFISRISDLVLDLVIDQQLRWRAAGMDLTTCVNLSGQDVLHESFVCSAIDRLSRSGLPVNALVMEITETAMVTDMERALANLSLFEAAGIRMAIDDFGTGYSSLAQLKSLPVHELKIDRSLVHELDASHDDQLIVRSTIEMAHSMGLKVVAEGVENQASLTLLREMGCDTIQGYFLARPMAAADLVIWLARPPHYLMDIRAALEEAV